MQFESVHDVLNMSGHGPYVWFAYVITGLILFVLCFSPIWRIRKVKTEIRRVQIRDSQSPNNHQSQ